MKNDSNNFNQYYHASFINKPKLILNILYSPTL